MTSPDGGEKWYHQGTEQLITWTASGVPGIVDITYSSDNGQSWSPVATALASDGQYKWTIPDDVSTSCLVRIEESVAGEAASDVSDAAFEIAQATITVDAPAGGENWVEWAEQDIYWTAPAGVGNVDILVSRDNGDSWSLVPNASGLGATSDPFKWTVSNPTSSQCRIRVRDSAEPANSGTSPAFTVAQLLIYQQAIAFRPTSAGLAWGDYDADGWMDLLVSGYYNTTGSNVLWLFHNESDGGAGRTLVEATGHDIAPDRMASLSWADSDGDGDLDLLFQGYSNRTRYYTNDGDGTFTNVGSPGDLYFQYMGCADWADHDNDGDLDATVTGVYMDLPNPNANKTFVYVNDGAGALGATPLDLPQGVNFSAVDWGDWDNDGDLDLAVIGDTDATATKTSYGGVFVNDAGSFTASTFGTILKLMDGDVEWGDFDGDGDLDVAAAGHVTPSSYTGRILENTGSDFAIAQYVAGLYNASVAWGDVDNDGDLDLGVAGTIGFGAIFKLYRNEGGTLVDTGSEAFGAYSGGIAWCDYDGDGDLDLAVAGNSSATGGNFTLYRNDWPGVKNTPPSAPTIDTGTYPPIVGGTVVGGKRAVTFRWLPASDAETTNAALLTYSLRVTPALGGNDVAPAMARTDGKRLVVRRGPIQASASVCQHTIWLATGVDYDWAVQAIDTAFEGSAWATAPSSVAVDP
ncbi:MAG: FG-GAP-like repeat-containing protein [Planctomycetota bacterium]